MTACPELVSGWRRHTGAGGEGRGKYPGVFGGDVGALNRDLMTFSFIFRALIYGFV